jgi:hypothetical protein
MPWQTDRLSWCQSTESRPARYVVGEGGQGAAGISCVTLKGLLDSTTAPFFFGTQSCEQNTGDRVDVGTVPQSITC